MRSFIAALRTLVLPWGATSGRRIILDGVEGIITMIGDETDLELGFTNGVQENPTLVFIPHEDSAARTQLSWDDFVEDSNPGKKLTFIARGVGTGHVELALKAFENSEPSRIETSVPIVFGGDNVEEWHDFTLLNSWSVSLSAQYRMMPDGTVMLRGLVQGGTTADGTVIATLPAGYRPSQSTAFVCACSNAQNCAHVEVQTDGDLVITRVGGVGTFLTLNEIRFAIADLA